MRSMIEVEVVAKIGVTNDEGPREALGGRLHYATGGTRYVKLYRDRADPCLPVIQESLCSESAEPGGGNNQAVPGWHQALDRGSAINWGLTLGLSG